MLYSLWIDPLPVEPEMNGGHLELYWTLVVPTVCPYNHQDVTVRRKPFAAISAFMGCGLGRHRMNYAGLMLVCARMSTVYLAGRRYELGTWMDLCYAYGCETAVSALMQNMQDARMATYNPAGYCLS